MKMCQLPIYKWKVTDLIIWWITFIPLRSPFEALCCWDRWSWVFLWSAAFVFLGLLMLKLRPSFAPELKLWGSSSTGMATTEWLLKEGPKPINERSRKTTILAELFQCLLLGLGGAECILNSSRDEFREVYVEEDIVLGSYEISFPFSSIAVFSWTYFHDSQPCNWHLIIFHIDSRPFSCLWWLLRFVSRFRKWNNVDGMRKLVKVSTYMLHWYLYSYRIFGAMAVRKTLLFIWSPKVIWLQTKK